MNFSKGKVPLSTIIINKNTEVNKSKCSYKSVKSLEIPVYFYGSAQLSEGLRFRCHNVLLLWVCVLLQT